MSKEKQQIEEMAKELCGMNIACKDCKLDKLCLARNSADILYNAGYHKQEWISVEERLPEPYERCLVAAKVGDRMVVDLGERTWVHDYRKNESYYEWIITNDWDEGEGCEITHWMPLPETPKMKGGAE